jgi:hypothetical protein
MHVIPLFDCWWALFGNSVAENGGEVTVYTKHQELKQADKQAPQPNHGFLIAGGFSVFPSPLPAQPDPTRFRDPCSKSCFCNRHPVAAGATCQCGGSAAAERASHNEKTRQQPGNGSKDRSQDRTAERGSPLLGTWLAAAMSESPGVTMGVRYPAKGIRSMRLLLREEVLLLSLLQNCPRQ